MSKKAMKLALEEMKIGNYNSAAERLEAALAKQEGQSNFCPNCEALARELKAIKQEQGEPAPVAKNENGSIKWLIDDWPQNCLLYTHTTPQQRTWVGLTDDERLEAAEIDGADEWFWKVCKAIEAKLKEKNT